MFGVVLVLAGFFTGLLVLNEKIWATQSYGDSRILLPQSDSLRTLNVSQRESVLQILVSANGTLVVYVLHDEKVEWKWEDTEFKNNVLIFDTGAWTVRILNNSTTTCDYTSTITLKEPHMELRKPYVWLRVPLFISGGLSMSLTVPMYFLDRFRSRLNRKTIEVFVVVAIISVVVFSYQIAGFVLQTSTPWVVCVGVSMEPTINFGDLVIIKGTEPENLVPDDVIVFRKVALVMGEEDFSTLSVPLLHRILYINKVGNHRYFKTKGDNSEKPDDWYVPDAGILGKSALVLPKLGYVLLLLERIEVKLFIIGIILMVFFVWPQIRSRKRVEEN